MFSIHLIFFSLQMDAFYFIYNPASNDMEQSIHNAKFVYAGMHCAKACIIHAIRFFIENNANFENLKTQQLLFFGNSQKKNVSITRKHLV